MKISVIGAGNVGATAANMIALKGFAHEVVLLDIKPGFAEGKAMDMMQTAHMLGIDTRITGITGDYTQTADSSIVIITSGLARRPGMTREELVGKNARIVKDVMDNCLQYSPEAVFIIVSNPADTLTYLAIKDSGLPRNRIIGMSGLLDSSRFIYFLSQALSCNPNDVSGMVIGVHGDLMVPLVRQASCQGQPVTELLNKEQLSKIVEDTKLGGGTLTKLLGTSAWYAPGASIAAMAEAIALDSGRIISCITYLNGEYQEKDVCAAVPVVLGKTGIKKIVELPLTADEAADFLKSTAKSHKVNQQLDSCLK